MNELPTPTPTQSPRATRPAVWKALVPSGVVINSIEDLTAIAQILFKGGLRPSWASRYEDLVTVILAGQAVGVQPVQAVNGIMIMGGRAVIWGDLALALVRSSGLLEEFAERIDGQGDNRKATCRVKRRGEQQAVEQSYSMADARQAGLLDEKRHKKTGPWWTNPDRQLRMRARSFALRDTFTDVLCGLGIAEEETDFTGTTAAAVNAEVIRVSPVSPSPVSPANQVPQALTESSESNQSNGSATSSPVAASTGSTGSDDFKFDVKLVDQIAEARPAWFRSKGIDPNDPGQKTAQKEAWVGLLRERYSVESLKQLDQQQAQDLWTYLQVEKFEQEKREVFLPQG